MTKYIIFTVTENCIPFKSSMDLKALSEYIKHHDWIIDCLEGIAIQTDKIVFVKIDK